MVIKKILRYYDIKILCAIVLSIFLVSLYPNILVSRVFAQTLTPSAGLQTEVRATVGDFYLSVSGFISPNASLVVSDSNGVFITSGVADPQGNFSFSNILIRRNFPGFCIQAVDFARLGESYTCFPYGQITQDIVIIDLFLPPTLGLSRSEIGVGGQAIAFGYTMPNATVTLRLGDGSTRTATANNTGYYEFSLTNLPVGTYDLSAVAHYNGKDSIQPTRPVQLKVLSYTEQLLAFLRNLWKKFLKLLSSIQIAPILFGIPLLILIIFLILKIWPERFTFIYESRLVRFLTRLLRRGRRLHHWWFIGY